MVIKLDRQEGLKAVEETVVVEVEAESQAVKELEERLEVRKEVVN